MYNVHNGESSVTKIERGGDSGSWCRKNKRRSAGTAAASVGLARRPTERNIAAFKNNDSKKKIKKKLCFAFPATE